jgi:hypothetical protein
MASYVSIYTLRQRVEQARGRIAHWQQKLEEAQAELKAAETRGDPPPCMDTLCHRHAKYRVGGTEETCASHLMMAIQSFNSTGAGAASVEVWPWERELVDDDGSDD